MLIFFYVIPSLNVIVQNINLLLLQKKGFANLAKPFFVVLAELFYNFFFLNLYNFTCFLRIGEANYAQLVNVPIWA